MGEAAQKINFDQDDGVKTYNVLGTIREFHESPAQIRCIVGPVGSGKTTGAAWEICYYLPKFLFDEYGIKRTCWCIVRNTYRELKDTTWKTVMDWFGWGRWSEKNETLILTYPGGYEAEIKFRACDQANAAKKFKSLELTGYWIDESIEVKDAIKQMLKNRIGRYPRKSPVRFGIETTNPPEVEHPTYSQFKWTTPPPGPVPSGVPLKNHVGFWQPPRENEPNLRPAYYDDLISDYADNPDWIEMYVEGKPGMVVQGRLVYANFRRDLHVAKNSLAWNGSPLIRGWDNSGNCPACVVGQMPTAGQLQVLAEFHTDREGIVDFTRRVTAECALRFPGAKIAGDWADPAGHNEFSRRDGGFTSNAKLMCEAGVNVLPSEQNLRARLESVDQALGRIDGLLLDPGCTRLINGFLGGYCHKEIGSTGTYSDKPEKNRFSHPHDALQYLVVKVAGGVSVKAPVFRPQRRRTARPR